MDPNVTLENILRGNLIATHAMALEECFARDVLVASYEATVPDECAPFLARHCAKHYHSVERSTIRVRANEAGLWTAPLDGPWISLAIWLDLFRMEDTSGLP
jgi:hypothetical protein